MKNKKIVNQLIADYDMTQEGAVEICEKIRPGYRDDIAILLSLKTLYPNCYLWNRKYTKRSTTHHFDLEFKEIVLEGHAYKINKYFTEHAQIIQIMAETGKKFSGYFEKISKTDILKIKNLTRYKKLIDLIGLERLIEIMEAVEVDRREDMVLYRFEQVGQFVKVLQVTCPSTGKIYWLYPPNQNAINCSEAKASTFADKQLSYRHGDVGLSFLDRPNPSVPFSES